VVFASIDVTGKEEEEKDKFMYRKGNKRWRYGIELAVEW